MLALVTLEWPSVLEFRIFNNSTNSALVITILARVLGFPIDISHNVFFDSEKIIDNPNYAT